MIQLLISAATAFAFTIFVTPIGIRVLRAHSIGQFIQEDETIFVTGSGFYQIDSGQHRLTLDLLVGAEPVRQFDSGLVPLQSEIPGISIAVALNGFYCYDNVFDITARPAPVELTSSTWGSLKSNFR